MSNPSSKDGLKQYALRALGKPVIEINVDDHQVDDRIDEALQYFAQYHYDGVRRTYLKYEYTQADKNRIIGTSSETRTEGSSASTTWEEDNSYLMIPESVMSYQYFSILK
jgi:hypothetical protein